MVQLEKVDERNSFMENIIKLTQNFRKPKQAKNHLRNFKSM